MEDVEAERGLLKSSAKFIDDDYDWGWTPEELEAGLIGGDACLKLMNSAALWWSGYRDVPELYAVRCGT